MEDYEWFPFNKARELQNLDEEDQYDEQKRNIGSFQSEISSTIEEANTLKNLVSSRANLVELYE